jgi:hypothetical protein
LVYHVVDWEQAQVALPRNFKAYFELALRLSFRSQFLCCGCLIVTAFLTVCQPVSETISGWVVRVVFSIVGIFLGSAAIAVAFFPSSRLALRATVPLVLTLSLLALFAKPSVERVAFLVMIQMALGITYVLLRMLYSAMFISSETSEHIFVANLDRILWGTKKRWQ